MLARRNIVLYHLITFLNIIDSKSFRKVTQDGETSVVFLIYWEYSLKNRLNESTSPKARKY